MRLSRIVIALVPFIFLMLLSGCSTTILLSDSPSDLVLTSIKPDSKNTVTYKYSSQVPHGYSYHSFNFPINRAMMQNIQSYITTKFLNVSQMPGDSVYVLGFDLESFNVNYSNQNGFITGLANVLSAAANNGDHVGYHGTATVNLAIEVQVYRDGKDIGQKDFFTHGEASGRSYNGDPNQESLTKAANDAISRAFIMVDKYLTAEGI